MIGKWHRTYSYGSPPDLPSNGQQVAVYFFMTGYGIYTFEKIYDAEMGCAPDVFSGDRGFLGDEDLLWSSNLDFALLKEPIPEEYLEYPDHYTQNPNGRFWSRASGFPPSVSSRSHRKLGCHPKNEVMLHGEVESSANAATCRAYARQLKRMYPLDTFGIKWDSPNLPTCQVVVYYYEESDLQLKELPDNWDEQALKEIR